MLSRIARTILIVAAMVMAVTTFALAETSATLAQNVQTQPAPAPKATTKPRLTWRITTRAYDFSRQNASNSTQGGANSSLFNQSSFEAGISPHVEYNVWNGLSVGATYFYGNPLNGCTTPVAFTAHGACPPVSKNAYNAGQINPDLTLPGYQLNTLDEAYVTYKDSHYYAKVGNQIINQPWAPASYGRIKESAFQGADATVTLTPNWLVEGTDMVRFEPRNASDFARETLLTDAPAYPGATALASNIYNPSGQSIQTNGFTMGRIGYTGGALGANFYTYNFTDIATAYWLDGKYSLRGLPFNPYIQVQFGDERNTGSSVIGKVDSQVYGVLGGLNLTRNILLTVAYDGMPVKTDTVTLPAGYTCNGANGISVKGAKESLPYFLPAGGTAQCSKNANGTTNLYYGGWASPYSYSYATDPLFTTSLTQGMVDRASAGASYLGRVTYTSTNHKLVVYASYASYDYNNGGGAQATRETDADATYYFGKPAAAGQLYKGFMFRYRYGARNQSGNVLPLPNGFGGTPLFKYNRFMAEYDF